MRARPYLTAPNELNAKFDPEPRYPWPLQAGLARTEFSQFFSFTGTVKSTSDVWCGRLLKMTKTSG